MAHLHDTTVRTTLEARLRALRADMTPRWGKMSVDQMLWHVNQAMATSLGRVEAPPDKAPLPRPVMKFLVLNLPWVKNAPTNTSFVARARHDFEAERARCLELIKAVGDRPVAGVWQRHPMFGSMTGREVSRLQAKHLDHHFKQFGV